MGVLLAQQQGLIYHFPRKMPVPSQEYDSNGPFIRLVYKVIVLFCLLMVFPVLNIFENNFEYNFVQYTIKKNILTSLQMNQYLHITCITYDICISTSVIKLEIYPL